MLFVDIMSSRFQRFNSTRERLQQEILAFSHEIPEQSRVLDAGSGRAPYRHFFSHARYETADRATTASGGNGAVKHHCCDLSNMPMDDGAYDFIIFTQVLEHVPEPFLVISELFRILRPGGRLLFTGPHFYEEHELPLDFYRYTSFGVRHLFGKAGFRIDRLDWLEGYYGSQLEVAARALPQRPACYGGPPIGFLHAAVAVFLKRLLGVLSIYFHHLEMRFKYTECGMQKNFVAVMTKPEIGKEM